MIKHIVMWKLVDGKDGKTKSQIAEELKVKLLELKPLIPELKGIEVGINEINFDKNSDVVLTTEFDSYDDLAVYAKHPDHVKVVDFVKTIATDRACVDYTL